MEALIKVGNYIKTLDAFGVPVTLRFQNYGTYTTVIGGLLSVAYRVFVFIYVVVMANALFHNKATNSRDTISTDVVREPLNMHLNTDNFQMAIKLYFGRVALRDLDVQRYFRV